VYFKNRQMIIAIVMGYGGGPNDHATTLYEYDCNGNRTGVTDPCTGKTTCSYDPSDRLAQSQDPHGAVTKYDYDNNGNRKAVWVNNPAGGGMVKAQEFLYNARNEMYQSKDPFGNGSVSEFNDDGSVKIRTDARGYKTGVLGQRS
jgi:YD repeat-containing protein